MHVLQLVASASRLAGGMFESVEALGFALQNAGVSVGLAAMSDKYSGQDLEKWRTNVSKCYWTIGRGNWAVAPGMLFDVFGGVKPDVVILHGLWQWTSVVALAYRKRGVSVVISPHGMLDPWAVQNSGWKKNLALKCYERTNLDSASLFRALNESEARSIREFVGPNASARILVLPNGIDLPVAAASLGPPSGKRTLTFVGRLHPKKGVLQLLDAWNQCRVGRNWELVVAGWGDDGYTQRVADRCAQLKERGVRFVGPVFGEAKHELFSSSTAFILPSFSEGLPMAVLEAWSYSLPVLMSTECNLEKGFQCGAALNCGNTVESIRASLSNLFEMSTETLTSIGRNGRVLCESEFDWSRIGQDLAQVLTRLHSRTMQQVVQLDA